MTLHITQTWSAAPEGTKGSFHFRLRNFGTAAVPMARFCYTSLGRIDETTDVVGGSVARNFGSFVEIRPDIAELAPGASWDLHLRGLIYGASNRTQGLITAWTEGPEGHATTVAFDDLQPLENLPRGATKQWPRGKAVHPLGLLPWPNAVDITDWHDAVPSLCPAEGVDPAPFVTVAALHRRLFPLAATAIRPCPDDGAMAVTTATDPALPAEGYRIAFGPTIDIAHADKDGLRHALIALTQIAQTARSDAGYRFPRAGIIEDAPRFGWRGVMFDVSRNFFPVATHRRLLDVMAWLRMNRLHWHLTDDEGWRIPSAAFPQLNATGATRRRGAPMPPQYGDGPDGQSGFYPPEDIAAVLDHAAMLGIEVMPEVEMPGHASSLIASVPGLRDPEEPENAYRSVQGFTNNALNPGLPRSYEVAHTLLDEAATFFPFEIIHVGADEVEHTAWSRSPAAQAHASLHGLSGTAELQAHFLRRAQAHLAERGRRIGAWDEAAEGGGISPDTAVLFAWRSKERVAELIREGYDVVATPGQAYYLDMVESEGWDARGISWAGAATPEDSYAYEVGLDLPEGPGRLLGVQAGIWTEYLHTTERLNAMMFPRLAAVSEAAWTAGDRKDADRFFALSHLVPQL
ncbi:beta-N-acetylhexosaminidase [Paracoccus sp. 1_MG-2023]|uniref:beta-N-acetylhexosaminidase n=1 Tax=unclassified Paracoccus (in: a-proteobacteria) TaxID=2688777 RepID=UPI001C094211|nr:MULTISPECIES: beta-N-acetylhexosaminidase [unclassified Paracoccus (in: a-proteobacteria)]MBU2956332.1 beta-N-acetylhexosaminidase [Paracoccus sp. C2R09]MDO6668008.1 beta-N-acetylhexosaminidase [Paracoccus sp. 1_MG-2023]